MFWGFPAIIFVSSKYIIKHSLNLRISLGETETKEKHVEGFQIYSNSSISSIEELIILFSTLIISNFSNILN